MTEPGSPAAPEKASGSSRLAILLAMAMFVLVVDTSLMNVSISAVVRDLDTTVSGVQSAIALEALVSAAFILIGSNVGDLMGRKRAYVLGLLGYAVGALAMTLAQGLTAIISVKLAQPQFEGQTKTKLGNSEAKPFVSGMVYSGLRDWLESHPGESKGIVMRAIDAQRARIAARQARGLTQRKSLL